MLRVAGIAESSIVDGPGFRYTVFLQGCPHACDGCHNPSTWSKDGGTLMEREQLLNKIKAAYFIDGLTISGGEPFFQAEELAPFLISLKEQGYHIIVYTGYTFGEIETDPQKRACLPYIDVLIDGKYEKDKRSLSLRFRGSSNQRVIDVPNTLEQKQIVLLNWDEEE